MPELSEFVIRDRFDLHADCCHASRAREFTLTQHANLPAIADGEYMIIKSKLGNICL